MQEFYLGETKEMKFALTKLDLKVEVKKPLKKEEIFDGCRFTAKFKGEIVDNLKQLPIVQEVLDKLCLDSIHLARAELGMQSFKKQVFYFETFYAYSVDRRKFCVIDLHDYLTLMLKKQQQSKEPTQEVEEHERQN